MKFNKVYAIFGKTKRDAIWFFDNLIGDMLVKDIDSITKSQMATYCILRDGTKYIILPATIGGMKGHKYTDVFIQEGIDEDFIYDEIFPGLYMEDKRVPQITYWERGD